uniref:YggS family pyridoxal phosphate-dependent enzyme n=1 Tax=Synechococcus sp. UW106 TaxID=368495 RepID=UPI000E0EB0E2|nr:YggS family pyridoxal phosphate-dependent enzyme [Synechococcus sp. UW106]
MTDSFAARWQALQVDRPSSARLLAVSKGHPASAVRSVAELGQFDFGESRVQEALPKQKELIDLQLRWHFIGRLQSNKVRPVVKAFDFIHSVDSLLLAERVSRIALEEARQPDVMLQVKLRPDPTKGGLSADELCAIWSDLQALPGLRISGLMTMAPFEMAAKQRKELFSDCRSLADRFNLLECSMGMSTDWKEAAEAGSTWLRVGSALFGPRLVSTDSAN